ncbi:hypothetical protein DSO57_1008716 [Entomophthora muscae]|uniref:Uncharacterized protein n=1 Tax=Entomophthora muscae TaxID=34485 RepID=A0ACC2SW59_9FUNG|nr:hypothetical protein DSO57_1008716 [Entomophthora muscae]
MSMGMEQVVSNPNRTMRWALIKGSLLAMVPGEFVISTEPIHQAFGNNSFDIPPTLAETLVQRDPDHKAISIFYNRGRVRFGVRIWYEAPAKQYEKAAREIAALFEPLHTFDFYPRSSFLEIGFKTLAEAEVALRKPLCSGPTLLHKARPCGDGEAFHILRITHLPFFLPYQEIRQMLEAGLASYGRLLGISVQDQGEANGVLGPIVHITMSQLDSSTLHIPLQAMLLPTITYNFKIENTHAPACFRCSRYGHYSTVCTAGYCPKFSILWGE